MSAAELREAAALIRQRAEAATGSTWTHGPHFQRVNCASVFAGKRTDGHYLAMYATPADAEHIASWHPAVALAVADWLEAESQAHIHVDGEPQSVYDRPGMETSPAVSLARAYLGRES